MPVVEHRDPVVGILQRPVMAQRARRSRAARASITRAGVADDVNRRPPRPLRGRAAARVPTRCRSRPRSRTPRSAHRPRSPTAHAPRRGRRGCGPAGASAIVASARARRYSSTTISVSSVDRGLRGRFVERDDAVLDQVDAIAGGQHVHVVVQDHDDRDVALGLEAGDQVEDHRALLGPHGGQAARRAG